jgi:hypothetical protein
MLSDAEGEALRHGEAVSCRNHRHCGEREASRMLRTSLTQHDPAAHYALLSDGKVSKRAIVIRTSYAWVTVGQTKRGYGPGMPGKQLVRSARRSSMAEGGNCRQW